MGYTSGPISVSVISGLNVKNSCRVATTTTLPANTYVNGVLGVGATLTENAFGALTVDGVAVAVGDRVLVKNEAAGANNGIYTVTATGGGAAFYVLTRASDYDQASEWSEGDTTAIEEGTTNVATSWILVTAGPYTVGTTALTFTEYAATPTGAAGGDLTGTYPNPTVGTAKITLAQQANVATNRIIGRGTTGSGVEEALVPTNLYLGNATLMARSDRSRAWSGNLMAASNADIPWFAWSANATITMTAATVYFAKIPLPGSAQSTYSITNVLAYLNTKAGSTLTNSFAGLVSSAGAQLGISADESSANQNWSTTGAAGLKTHALVGGPITVTPTGVDDFVYACLYIGTTAGTAPLWQASALATAPTAFLNMGTANAASLMGTLAVANTATPFTGMTLSSITPTAQAIWMGIS